EGSSTSDQQVSVSSSGASYNDATGDTSSYSSQKDISWNSVGKNSSINTDGISTSTNAGIVNVEVHTLANTINGNLPALTNTTGTGSSDFVGTRTTVMKNQWDNANYTNTVLQNDADDDTAMNLAT